FDLQLRISAHSQLVKMGVNEHIPQLRSLLECGSDGQEQAVRDAVWNLVGNQADNLIDLLHRTKNTIVRRAALDQATAPWWFEEVAPLASDPHLSIEERVDLVKEWHRRLSIPPPPRMLETDEGVEFEDERDDDAERLRMQRVEAAAELLGRVLSEAIEQRPA